MLDEGGRVVAPKNEVGRNKPSIYMRGCGRQSPAEKLEHMQQDVLDLKQRLKNCESHSGDTDGGPVTHDAEEHVYLYASYYEYSLYEAEHERSENYTWVRFSLHSPAVTTNTARCSTVSSLPFSSQHKHTHAHIHIHIHTHSYSLIHRPLFVAALRVDRPPTGEPQ